MIKIGKYTADDKPIGSGGMGQVFKGFTPDGRPVAIKEILPQFVSNEEYRSRIESEINFLKKLNNERVVKIFDHFELDGKLYIIMEFIDGRTIEQYVEQTGRMGWQDAVKYMIELLHTMQDVHEHGIIHRDIKPGNIMIRENGDVCLLDFGVAKDVYQDENEQSGHIPTVLGTVIGTDGYMSPEQASGYSIDHRSDIYALGCVLYFMLTGYHAFGSEQSELGLHIAITEGNFPRLSDKVAGLPASLQKVLDHAVDKNMMKRMQSCREFANELAGTLPGGTAINTLAGIDNLSVSIGRENCDICVGMENFKVSRHHGDIRLKRFTGGEFFVYTDCSSNGTLINGTMLRKGMSYNIPKGDNPAILLAGDPSCRLDMKEVENLLELRRKEIEKKDTSKIKPSFTSSDIKTGLNNQPGVAADPDSFIGAIVSTLKNYAVFKGRASRSQYWWFVLFAFLIQSLVTLICIVSNLRPEELMIAAFCVSAALLLPSLGLTVRRLHDIGKGGGWIFISCVPFIGGIWLLILMLTPGEPGENRFGPGSQSIQRKEPPAPEQISSIY